MTTQCERLAGRGLHALLAGDWRVTGPFSKLRAVYGKCTWLAGRWLAVPSTGAFSTLLRRPGLRASTVAFWQH